MLFEFIKEIIEEMLIPIEKLWDNTEHIDISIIAISPQSIAAKHLQAIL